MRSRRISLFLFACTGLALALTGCTSNSPDQASNGTWRVYGRTYLVASVDPLPGVALKCAGMSTVSGSDGSYEFRGVPAGTQIITAQKSNCEDFSQSIDVRSDTRYYVFLTFNGTALTGRVTNALDGPISSAKLTIDGIVGYSDASGQYQLSDIPHGTDTLYVTHPIYNAYKTALTLNASNQQLDVLMRRDSTIQGTTTLDCYVDESAPTFNFGSSVLLTLSPNGYDSLAHLTYNHNQRNIYLRFDFPALLTDSRVSVVDANLQIYTTAPYAPFTFQTYSLTSLWNATTTFNKQPAIGSLLTFGVAGNYSMTYCLVLRTDGFNKLLADFRATGLNCGIVIQGGGFPYVSFYSRRSTQLRPKISITMRY